MSDSRVPFSDIYLATEPYVKSVGQVRIGASGIGWKAAEGEAEALQGVNIPGLSMPAGMLALQREDLRRLQWQRVARGYGLRIYTKSGTLHKLDGFTADDYEQLRDAVKRFFSGLTLEVRDISFKGWNWGKTDFEGSDMSFRVENRPMFDLPMAYVSNTNLANKNEVSVEFQPPRATGKGTKRKGAPDELVEVRFYVPGTIATGAAIPAARDDDENMSVDGEKSDNDDEVSAASAFHEAIKNAADLGQVSGDSIVQFPEILCLTPRGRYGIDMFSNFLRLRGKTYDYKIPYDNVQRLFLVSKPDELHMMFIVGLNPPIRQGQTRYPYLVLQFVRDEEVAIDLNLEADEDAKRKTEAAKLRKHYDEPLYRIVATVFKAMTDKRLIEGGGFGGYHGSQGIKASLKANEGTLYPLDKGFLFAPKPAHYIPHSEISSIVFSRVDASSSNKMRTFDLKFNMHGAQDYQFVSINREEHATLEEYMTKHGIKMLSELNETTAVSYKGMDADDDDESDEDVTPATLLGAGGGGAAALNASVGAMGLGSDEDESEDEDFVAGSESDVPEEYDENYESPDDAEE
ncbi:FACT complex subunit [Coemansia sp. RSA 376]|nr:FACT complex subunit [Coemansia sp. S680]KAJ2041331.1 FACT complex subunit [Coemansia sp. S3946]KAJ2054223.1 FACT complex subunit [Coemansia sp. S16]KAJ2075431.1 FACT complex subunit [Coemansia sp. S155-1]KAJ2113861.1 FACT complex subunit [Coemansia sp. RSA 922]KAJ2264186.1 FACT complex subunit [Coemansia sp. RSA 376]KAJ2432333.1 FACT complex subunit [Coemansia sp. RSA 2531]KAJ2469467.1 FACT complex subunit [Coemansia sp. RSA 2337]